MTRWLVTGAGGQLGTDVMAVLGAQEADARGFDRATFDIADPDAVEVTLSAVAPTVVVNCAAYTAVDAAEADESAATVVNGEAPGNLARWCAAHRARFIQVSTDYVFAGDATMPYEVDHPTDPGSAYGRSKLAGERATVAAGGDAHVVRTAWVYGATGSNFVKTIARLAREQETLRVVDDQIGSPTWSYQLAAALVALGLAPVEPGIWHCSGAGQTSWYGLAGAIFSELGLDPARITPTTTAEFPRRAPRPAYSVLSNRKWLAAGLPGLPPWRDALHEALASGLTG